MKKMLAFLLSAMLLVVLAGCGEKESVTPAQTSSTDSAGNSQAESSVGESSATPLQASSADSAPSEKEQEDSEKWSGETASVPSSESRTNPPSSAGGSGKPGTASPPAPSESPASERTTSSESVSTPSVEPSAPVKEPDPIPMPQSSAPEPAAFDIAHWVQFAKSYGTSDVVGLAWDPSATSCNDDPIIAGPKSKYLERDIHGILDWYKTQGFTGFYCWYKSRGDGTYSLFIGYA